MEIPELTLSNNGQFEKKVIAHLKKKIKRFEKNERVCIAYSLKNERVCVDNCRFYV